MQGWSTEETSEADPNSYETVTCLACAQLHFVNATSGNGPNVPKRHPAFAYKHPGGSPNTKAFHYHDPRSDKRAVHAMP